MNIFVIIRNLKRSSVLELYQNPKIRFLLAGGINSGASYGLYWILLKWLDYRLAYGVAYIFGIALAYVLNSRMVFSQRMSVRSMMTYPVVYLVCYLLGTGILMILVQGMNMKQEWAAMIAMILVIPVSFLINRVYFRKT